MSTEFYNRNWRMPKSSNLNKVSNYSMSFDGSSEYIDCGTTLNSMLEIGDSFSISAWVKFGSGTTNRTIISNMDTSIKGFQFRVLPNESIRIIFAQSGSAFFFVDSSPLVVDTWHHALFTYDGSNTISGLNLYINGSLDNNSTAFRNVTTITSSSSVDLGRRPKNDHYYNGKIDHVAIFDYALSSSQVTSLYGNSTDGVGDPMAISPKPKAYYPIGDYAAFNGSEYLVPNGALSDYVFDFDNDRVTTTSLTNLSITNEFSVSFWANVRNVVSYAEVIGASTSNSWNDGFGVYLLSSKWVFFVDTYFTTKVTSDTTITAGEWVHLAITFSSSGTGKLYVNGDKEGTDITGVTLDGLSSTFEIGTIFAASTFEGMLGNVQIWNKELISSEIETLYNNGTPYIGTQPQPSNLQGWWKLDASATFDSSTSTWSIPDDSSNSNTGTSNGMTAANLVQSTLNILSPYSRYALSFDGTNDYIETSSHPMDFTTGNFTCSAWINVANDANHQGIIAIRNSTSTELQFYVRNNNELYSWNGTSDVTSTSTITNDVWNHVVLIQDGSNKKFYINGVLDNTVAQGNGSSSTATFKIGYSGHGSEYTNGSISNVSIWNAALTSAQVTEIYNEGKPSNLNNHSAYSNLVSWWQLGENMSYDGTKWTVIDEKGTNNGEGTNLGPAESSIVNGVGTSANGLSSGMGGADNIIGDAPYSTANAVSYGMGVDALSTDVPS